MTSGRTKLTPPQVAARYGVSPDKVVRWIISGELRAFNAATEVGGRPRYLIDEADLSAFEVARAVGPVKVAQRRRSATAGVIQFF
jgi:excisionase family DNA binding protein